MRQYETAFLITPKLEEEETEKLIEKMAEVVKKKKGKMVNIEKWGKRRLAYSIDKLDEAVYVFFHYEGDPDIPHELQRRFRQTETVLRYLTLKKDAQIQPRKKTKTSRKEKTKRAEERVMKAAETEKKREEPPEKLPETPPEVKEPEPEKLAEEKE
jgi:small subunit ribosomal protein S6